MPLLSNHSSPLTDSREFRLWNYSGSIKPTLDRVDRLLNLRVDSEFAASLKDDSRDKLKVGLHTSQRTCKFDSFNQTTKIKIRRIHSVLNLLVWRTLSKCHVATGHSKIDCVVAGTCTCWMEQLSVITKRRCIVLALKLSDVDGVENRERH